MKPIFLSHSTEKKGIVTYNNWLQKDLNITKEEIATHNQNIE